MAVDLSHIPDVDLDPSSGRLIEAYLKTWRRVSSQPPDRIAEFLRHIDARTWLELDAPLDRKAMAILNLTILEHLRDQATKEKFETSQFEFLEEKREVFTSIARGELVAFDLSDKGPTRRSPPSRVPGSDSDLIADLWAQPLRGRREERSGGQGRRSRRACERTLDACEHLTTLTAWG